MHEIVERVQAFIDDLRISGVPIGPSEMRECYRSLLLINWSNKDIFCSTLRCTLLKEAVFLEVFKEMFEKHFIHNNTGLMDKPELEQREALILDMFLASQPSDKSKVLVSKSNEDCKEKAKSRPAAKSSPKRKDPFSLDFYNATYSSADEIQKMEKLIPLLAKRLTSKMLLKKRRNSGTIDYRRTLRQSMNTGGVPVDLHVKRKVREKPVIFALCDVSRSCLYFSYFSLAMVHLLEKFFREVRSFAFIGETDEITSLIKKQPYDQLTSVVLGEANVSGESGYTDYGQSLASFYEKYGQQLTHKTNILILGDARTNWFHSNPKVLDEINKRVKRVYWFNPEPLNQWGTGDSDMLTYQKYCTRAFECCNLSQLAQAISEIV